jgi:biotin carboxyl carrier protein
MRYFVTLDGQEHIIDVAELPGGGYRVGVIGDAEGAPVEALDADVVARDSLLSVRLGGRVLDLVVDGELPELDVYASGHRATVQVESARMRATASVRGKKAGAGEGVVVSPMPGKVVKLLVHEGDEVSEGTPLVVVEAMKMENELVSERAGVVQKVFVETGDAVEGGARLIAVG